MAITYLTLEESADKLGIPVAEFKKRLRTEWTHIRPLQDGSTQRFKSKDIEELGRQIGIGSEEELQLVAPSDEETVPLELHMPDEEDLAQTLKPASSKSRLSPNKPTSKKAPEADVLPMDDEEVALGSKEIFLMADDQPKSAKKSSGKIRSAPAKPDSDVRLEPSVKMKRPTAEQTATTDEIELDILPSSSGKASSSSKLGASSSGKLKTPTPNKTGPKSGKLSPPPPDADSSEFELNLDADSSDEFELSLANDSDEISLGDLPAPSSSDSKAGLASGINLSKPKDKGLSLEKGDGRSSKKLPQVKPQDVNEAGKSSKKLPAPKLDSDEEVDFELSLDSPGASSKKIASSKKLDGDSEFDLTLDDASDPVSLDAETGSLHAALDDDQPKNDIFETDFEIPALDDDSASEAVAIEEADTDLESSSDFDLAIDEDGSGTDEEESGSQVVVLDDEIEDDEPKARKSSKNKKKKKLAAVEVEDDEAGVSFDDMDVDDDDESAGGALRGVRAEAAEDEDEREPVVVGSAPWGVLPALFMFPTVFIVFVGGLMAYEMMHSMWGYHQPTSPSTIVIDQVADMLDLKPKDDLPVKK